MSWYYINIPAWSQTDARLRAGVISRSGSRLGPMHTDFQTVLLLTQNSRLLTGANVQLFQWMGTGWQEVQVA
jgi:hypothetical protein